HTNNTSNGALKASWGHGSFIFGRRRGGAQRQHDREDGAVGALAALAVQHGQLAAVRRDDAPRDVEPEPAAHRVGIALLEPREGLEDALALGLGDARAVVADANVDALVVLPDAQLDGAAFGGVFDGVVYEVANGLEHAVGVDLGHERVIWALQRELP